MEFHGSIVENEVESSLEGIKSMRRGFWLVMALSRELKVLLLSIGFLRTCINKKTSIEDLDKGFQKIRETKSLENSTKCKMLQEAENISLCH